MATVVHDCMCGHNFIQVLAHPSIVSEAYDFSHQDKELYTIKARNLLYYVEPQTSSIHTLYADSHGHNTSISGLTQRKTQTTKEGSSYNGCTDLQQADLSAAAPNAQKYADDALSFVLWRLLAVRFLTKSHLQLPQGAQVHDNEIRYLVWQLRRRQAFHRPQPF